MQLFVLALEQEVARLHENNIRFKVVGDINRFEPRLTKLIGEAETLTVNNTKLTLTVAANYGGRWDIMQAVQRMLLDRPELAKGFNEDDLAPYLAMHYAPEPDLFIRTGGEQRISNFLLWQMAYTEMYFTETLWPDFNSQSLNLAILSYQQRERRFGRTSEQLEEARSPAAKADAVTLAKSLRRAKQNA
jgi:undecaprenyl diphosphate synthase